MRKLGVLLALVVIVTAAPAYGRKTWVGDPVTLTGSFHVGSNWDLAGVPGASDAVTIRNGGTVLIFEGSTQTSRIGVGYWSKGSGHVEVNADVHVNVPGSSITVGEYFSAALPVPTWTQRAGTVSADYLKIGRPDSGSSALPNSGWGKYTISGGTYQGLYNGIDNGGKDEGAGAGHGVFRVEGDASSILIRRFDQTAVSRLEGILSATGGLSAIDVTPTQPPYGDSDKVSDVEGTLLIDDSAATPTVGDIVTVLTVTGAPTPGAWLDYTTLTMDPASSPGWVLISDDGIRDSIQVQYVPEPATMLLLGLGGLSLIRRRKR